LSEKRSETSVSGKTFVRGKTIDDDERRGRPQAARVIRRIVAEKRATSAKSAGRTSKGGGSGRLLKRLPQGPADKVAARRVMIKLSYAPNRKAGQWSAHGSYLERESAQVEGEKGKGFDANEDEVSIHARLHTWQMAGDPRLFKVVLSPEDGQRLNLPEFTRDTMARLSPHLAEDPSSIEWVAIDHHNTGHPHVHLLIRGKDGLRIAPDLIKTGMRNLASEVATERLGYKSPAEQLRTRETQIEARSLTSLDREIDRQAKSLPDGRSFWQEEVKKPKDRGYAEQKQLMRRLEALEKLGLSEKVGSSTWTLDVGWMKALKELEVVRTRTKMVAESRALMTEPRCPPQVTKLKPGERLVGRVLGTGMDEQFDRSYLIIEGTDYRAHIVYQTAGIEKARAEQQLGLRHLVAIEGKGFLNREGKMISTLAVEDYGLVLPDKAEPFRAPQKALDDALDAGQQPAQPEQAVTGFQRYWHEQLLERSRERDRQKQIEKAQLEKERRAQAEQERLEKERLEKARIERESQEAQKPAVPSPVTPAPVAPAPVAPAPVAPDPVAPVPAKPEPTRPSGTPGTGRSVTGKPGTGKPGVGRKGGDRGDDLE